MSDNRSVTESRGASPAHRKRRFTWTTTNILGMLLLVGAVSFVAGTRSDELVAAVAPVFGIQASMDELSLNEVEATYDTLKKHYDGRLDAEALEDGASRGLVEATGDRYTTYMSKKEAADFEKELSGDIGGGIGAEIGVRNDTPTILRVLDDHPAKKAGLQSGDIVAGVNDDTTIDWTVDRVVEKIRGKEGTTVKLTVLRDGEPKEFTVTRAIINNPSVKSEVVGDIGVLTISRFDAETGTLARAEASKLKAAGVKGVILDLRGNGGGYVTAAQSVAGIWLDDKVIMTEKRDGKKVSDITSEGRPILNGMPTTVLVNGSSASASEIIAGAFKEYNVATLVGEKTFGKGSVQQVVDLPDGAKLKVTIAKWYTPKGTNITKEGIVPDTAVELTAEDANAGRDPQLEAAKEVLKK